MREGLKQRPLTLSVLTGVTALVGGIEPAAAGFVPLSQSFGTITASDTHSSSSGQTSGDFSATGSDPTSFNLFDTLGGTRALTGVTVTVTSESSNVEATASGSCASSSTGVGCGASATNDSTFSALISIAGPFSPLTQLLSTTASDSCTVGTPNTSCNYNESTSNPTLPNQFSFAATIGQLGLFVGPGTFNVTPRIDLAGEFSSFVNEGIFEPFTTESASTSWSGTIDVTYEYALVGAVPEPASLLLVGGGLAGLGFARRKPKRN